MAQFKFTVPDKKEAPTVKSAGSSRFNFTVPSGIPQPAISKKKKTTIGSASKSVAKAIVEPVATMVVRPMQLVDYASGSTEEQVNTRTKNAFGDWVAPIKPNAQGVYEDVGRGIQTALTGGLGGVAKSAILGTAPKIGLTGLGAIEGAGYGFGTSMEQGNDILSKGTAINTGLGAVTAGVGAKLIGKFGKKTPKEANIPNNTTVPVKETPVTLTPKMSEGGKVPIEKLGKGEVKIPPASEKRSMNIGDAGRELGEMGYTPKQFETIMQKVTSKYPNGQSKFTRSEIFKTAQDLVPELPHSAPSSAIIKARPPLPSGGPRKLTGEVIIPAPEPTIKGEAKLPAREPIQPVEFTKPEAPKPTAISQIASNPTEQKMIAERVEKSVLSELDSVPGTKEFERQTNKEQARIAMSETIERIEDVVFGNANPAKGSNRNAYLSVAFNMADEMARKGNTSLTNKLINSGIKRNLTGNIAQELQATQIIGNGNVTNLLAKLQQEMIEKMPKFRRTTRDAEIQKIKNQLKEILKDSTMSKVTKQQFKDVYNSIICK